MIWPGKGAKSIGARFGMRFALSPPAGIVLGCVSGNAIVLGCVSHFPPQLGDPRDPLPPTRESPETPTPTPEPRPHFASRKSYETPRNAKLAPTSPRQDLAPTTPRIGR